MMRIGDRVICIRTWSQDGITGAVKGRSYTILNNDICACGIVSFDVGIDSFPFSKYKYDSKWECDHCGHITKDTGIWWQDSIFFAPLEMDTCHNEILCSMTEETLDTEVPSHFITQIIKHNEKR